MDQDYSKALECYNRLSDDSIAAGSYQLGLMYYYGKGVSVDYRRAFDLFEKATQEISLRSGKLPFVHHDTDLLTDGPQNILVYRLLSSSEIIGESYYYLGLMYQNGEGSVQNEEVAQNYFKQALTHGCKRASYEIIH